MIGKFVFRVIFSTHVHHKQIDTIEKAFYECRSIQMSDMESLTCRFTDYICDEVRSITPSLEYLH